MHVSLPAAHIPGMSNQIAPEKAAQREGARKNDGKFGNQVHQEPPVSLGGAPARPEWLDGWPESFPEPELSYEVGDRGNISTFASVNGDVVFEAWSPYANITPVQAEGYTDIEFDGSDDPDAREAARGWVRKQHVAITGQVRAEMLAAAERIRHTVMAKVTGTAAPVTDEELERIVEQNSDASFAARKNWELAATARIARGVKDEFPDAKTILLKVYGGDEGSFISGFDVLDADGENLGFVEENDADYEWAQHILALSTDSGGADWSHFIEDDPQEEEDWYKINLDKAASWTPGSI